MDALKIAIHIKDKTSHVQCEFHIARLEFCVGLDWQLLGNTFTFTQNTSTFPHPWTIQDKISGITSLKPHRFIFDKESQLKKI